LKTVYRKYLSTCLLLLFGTVSFAATDTVYIGCRGGKTPKSNYANGNRLDSICAGQIKQLTDSLGHKKVIRAIRRPEMESGCRNKDSLFRSMYVRQRELMYAYNARGRNKSPCRPGYVITRLTINPDGELSKCQILESTLHDTEFENEISKKVLNWKFEKENKEDCTTVVLFTFYFTQ
jgi:hypothetical protein